MRLFGRSTQADRPSAKRSEARSQARSRARSHEAAQQAPVKEGGKGRPTPTRKEAEAAARERARGDKKASAKAQRATQGRRMREAMRSGDDRYLPARDKGPVKRFVRDFVDARLCFAEFLLPLLVLILILGQGGGGSQTLSSDLWIFTFLLTILDTSWMVYRMRKALRAKFGDQSLKGTTTYALMRVMQMRFMRMPKAKVRIGGKPKP